MRAALLGSILPPVMKKGESKQAALILMKNSHFDRTLRHMQNKLLFDSPEFGAIWKEILQECFYRAVFCLGSDKRAGKRTLLVVGQYAIRLFSSEPRLLRMSVQRTLAASKQDKNNCWHSNERCAFWCRLLLQQPHWKVCLSFDRTVHAAVLALH